MKKLQLTVTLILAALLATAAAASAADPIRAIRFDPGYSYSDHSDVDANELAETLCDKWADAGINLVYYLAHSNDGGARYFTQYKLNDMEDFGRQDLLGAMISSAHTRNIQVVAWFFDRQHKAAWKAHPEWRVRDRRGGDYKEREEDYFLSPFATEAMDWWRGMIEDLMVHYPDLDGVDIAEPVINWWGNHGDFSPAAMAALKKAHPEATTSTKTWLRFRGETLTAHLAATCALVRSFGKSAHITAILSAGRDGKLLSNDKTMYYTGFDLDGLLGHADAPDYVNVELIWQQWRSDFGTAVFNPNWTKQATKETINRVADRAELIIHVEASTFGETSPKAGDLSKSLAAAKVGGAIHLDCYDSSILDEAGWWNELAANYKSPKASMVALNH
jgi:uncharacterized lipoprotein YddW (UPF0748 family)